MKKLLPVFCSLIFASACMDPAHDNAVDALGNEAPGVPRGPLHRAGQPCLTCHGGEGPAGSEFSVAGTVYLLSYQETPAPGVNVLIEDSTGVAGIVPTNQVGSFWVNASEWRPTFPLQVTLQYGPINKQMPVPVNRSGSCADCHHLPGPQDPPMGASATSPGRVWLAQNQSQLNNLLMPPVSQ
jgi:hypothetical protein